MSASSALLQSIVSTVTPLRTVGRIRVRLLKKSLGNTQQAALRHFVEKRLPVLRFHNPSLQVEIARVASSAEGAPGIEVAKGATRYTLGYERMRDDEMFNAIVALDRAENAEQESALQGITKGELTPAVATKPKEKTAATAATAVAADAKPAATKA